MVPMSLLLLVIPFEQTDSRRITTGQMSDRVKRKENEYGQIYAGGSMDSMNNSPEDLGR